MLVVHVDDLAAESRRLLAESQAAAATAAELEERLRETLSPEQRKLFIQFHDAQGDAAITEATRHVAEIARHLPGVAPVIRMLFEHAIGEYLYDVGACCTPSEGFMA